MTTMSMLRAPERASSRARVLAGTLVGTVVTALLLLGVGAGRAAAATAPYVPWSSDLPGWSDTYVPSSDNDCAAGRPRCLTATRRELGRILNLTAPSCSHDAVFSLAYVRITQTYAWSREIPGYYQDLPYMNHMDAVFAKYYTDAFYQYRAGNRDAVPQAWQTAFDSARDKRTTGIGDLLLGMNAHINRDLPFVLEASGLVTPSGASGKPDYDKVEQFLNDATEPMLAEAAARFDPTLDDADDPLGVAYGSIFQMISAWRENAWRNAEALVSAPTPSARAQVAADIEAEANAAARTILLSQSTSPLSTSAARDSYCAAHQGDTAPMAYPFGTPAPYAS